MSPWGGVSEPLRHTRDTLVGPHVLPPEELEEVAGKRMKRIFRPKEPENRSKTERRFALTDRNVDRWKQPGWMNFTPTNDGRQKGQSL